MTPERKAAVQAVDAAIAALTELVDRECAEDGDEAFGGMMTAWVVVCSRTRFEDDGQSSTGIRVYMPESVSDWQQLGLLRGASLLIEADF